MLLLKEPNFPLEVLKGTAAPLGEGHAFCIREVPSDGLHGWFTFVGNSQQQQLPLTDVSRLEMSRGTLEVNPRKWAAPTAVAALSLLTPLPLFLEFIGISVAAVSSGFAKARVRFVCETVSGDYFTGTLSVTGFVAARTLWQKQAEYRVNPMFLN
ncbi:hypothetical protein F4054_00080 [Candidatus Poribacteria bacterium]|nr:hypothetical protein [Candidatus Poribacteria bacterium]MYG07526.1 hypothetical protein [Candidatus Poribacteria bacterium]MYK20643.1 hypothetical protein [Candidatus Poribacteria bacterium]